ncbi:vacuolar transporter chaperone [Linnemannia zychae]|nr:vacuolar transporter chaperone [Linnemannia zychae]
MSTSPTPNDGDISPSSNSYILSSSSGGSSTSHSYTPYQPPPIRQDSSGLSPQSNLAFRDGRLLDPEPVSPSTSTLVGSPMTPNRNGRRPFSWLGSSNDHQYSLSDITDSPDDIVRSSKGGHMASTYRLSKYKLSPNCKDDQEITSSVGPASAARTLGYHTQICSGGTSQNSQQFSQHAQQQSGLPGWESHVSVLMDEISLESFVPSDTPPKKNLREGIYNKRDINGRTSPASDFGQSSNTSMVTLLGQGNTTTANSSSTTLFGGFMSKSKSHNSFKRLNDPREDMGLQHQIITISASGKSYTQRPKDKKFGRKGGNGNGNGGVNAERKSLFSNERTLVHWIKFGILLGTMALTLCNFGRKGSLAFHIGSSLLLAAMTTLGYAVLTFHYRDRSLSRRLKVAMAKKRAKCNKNGNTEAVDPSLQATKDICYYDRTGPTVVCCVLIFACSINFYRK